MGYTPPPKPKDAGEFRAGQEGEEGFTGITINEDGVFVGCRKGEGKAIWSGAAWSFIACENQELLTFDDGKILFPAGAVELPIGRKSAVIGIEDFSLSLRGCKDILEKFAECSRDVAISMNDFVAINLALFQAGVIRSLSCPYCGTPDITPLKHPDIPGAPDTCPNCGGWLND